MSLTFINSQPPKVGNTFCLSGKVYQVIDRRRAGNQWKIKAEKKK